MSIKRFLKVIYIVSIFIIIIWPYKDRIINRIVKCIEEPFLILTIPSIKLSHNIYNMNSPLNNVDRNISILKSTNLEKNLFYIASHSGGGDASYFDDLAYLEKGDIIYITKKDNILAFVTDEIFYIQKRGTLEAFYSGYGNTLFLITCSLKYLDKQIIIKAKLVYDSKM